jgi:hypothetical protein
MSKKPTEKLKNVYKSSYLPELFENYGNVDIDEVIEKLQKAKEDGHTKVNFDVEIGGYDGYLRSVSFCAWHQREETDEEFEARVAAWQDAEKIKRDEAKERKAKNEAKEKKEYERLKKKWGS